MTKDSISPVSGLATTVPSKPNILFKGQQKNQDDNMRQDPAQFRAILDWAYAGRPRCGLLRVWSSRNQC